MTITSPPASVCAIAAPKLRHGAGRVQLLVSRPSEATKLRCCAANAVTGASDTAAAAAANTMRQRLRMISPERMADRSILWARSARCQSMMRECVQVDVNRLQQRCERLAPGPAHGLGGGGIAGRRGGRPIRAHE